MADRKTKYYSLTNILKENARYYVIIGERSNGKTYAVKDRMLFRYSTDGTQSAIIRRWDEDFKGKRGQEMFTDIVDNGLVEKYTKGKWTGITYKSSKWYFSKYDEVLDKTILDSQPFCYGFSLTGGEHDKSTSYPKIKTILFDEFLTRQMYLPEEFIRFMNTLSTIIRDKDDVQVFMCANTVNKYAPYFSEMGLNRVLKMEQGTIDVYNYGESGLKVAVEYCATNKKGKKSDTYFAFDNPKLKMITEGKWEIDIYPHLMVKYKPKDIKLSYFIVFNEQMLQCDVVKLKDSDNRICMFTYIHRKTTPLKDKKKDIIFSTEHNPRVNWFMSLGKPQNSIERELYAYFKQDKVFYQDNEVGELVKNYFNWCIAR